MQSADSAALSNEAEHLFAALTLAERVALSRQAQGVRAVAQQNAGRAAEAVARWKAQKPFDVADYFEKRLRLNSLTEQDLLGILGLPPHAHSESLTTMPEWFQDLRRLYSNEDCSSLNDDWFLKWTGEGTNAFLWIAYPLVEEGRSRFKEAVARLSPANAPFEPATVERLVLPNLFAALQPVVEKVMALELNVARVRGLLKGELPEERFRSFCDTLRHPGVRWSIVSEYPVLFRSLHLKTMNWIESSVEILERLAMDWAALRQTFSPGTEPGSLNAVSTGAGDSHRGGRTVAILDFSSGLKLVYKPHSLSLDVHFGSLVEWLNQIGCDPTFRTLKVIDRGLYGWSEFVHCQPCSSQLEVQRFYERLGGYLAIFHALDATDMHFENLIAAGEFPIPVDLETLFHPALGDKDDPAVDGWLTSVMRVHLLPNRSFGSSTEEGVDMSALGATSGQYYPSGRSTSWEATGTDEMRLVLDKPVPMKGAENRPKLEGQELPAEEFLENFVTGFARTYRLIEAHREPLVAPGGILDRFGNDEVRFIARPTGVYDTLLAKSFHPDMLRDAISRDQLFDTVWRSTALFPHLIPLIPSELLDLDGGDIPVFIAKPNSRHLWTSRGELIPEFFEEKPIELVRKGLRDFGKRDLTLQTSHIRATIASAGKSIHTSSSGKLQLSEDRSALGLARAVGDALCRESLENDSYAGWIGLKPLGPRQTSWSWEPLGWDFYGGLSGCSFFLAYLGALTGVSFYSKIARKSIDLVLRQLARQRTLHQPVRDWGGYSGAGGVIYTLAHLGFLWQDARLLESAKSLATGIPSVIEADRMLDVIGGSAGCIAALAVLNAVSPSDHLRAAALLCGERILAQRQRQDTGVGWRTEIPATQPLTGFAHGAGGIAWALLKLAAWSKDSRFRAAAESAIRYERSTYVVGEGNWPDFRDLGLREAESGPGFSVAWCHGAPGIGLARLDSLEHMDDPKIREEIRIALRKTVDSGFGADHCLCHGDLGNLDILQYASRHGDPYWWNEFGKRRADETLATIAEQGCSCGTSNCLESPGLMTGLAGIGYGLLRLACPERVPSVLVLAPPEKA